MGEYMGDLNNSNKNFDILKIISIVKLTTTMLIIIILFNIFFKGECKVQTIIARNISYFSLLLVPILLIIGYGVWIYMYVSKASCKHIKVMQIIEDIFYLTFVTILILYTNTYDSQYKILFIFNIVSATISLGKSYGLKISWISSIIICSVDLIFKQDVQVNSYLQNDLIISVGFIFISWILGEYIDSEDVLKNKLKSELIVKTESHNYIEEMLLKNEDCFDLLIKSSQEAIFIHNEDGILYSNEKAKLILEVNSDDYPVKYKKNKITSNEKYQDIYFNKLVKVSFEQKIKYRNGEEHIFLNTASFCTYGKKNAVLSIIRDITPAKQVQQLKKDAEENIKILNELKEYNKYITDFFSNISHELKTPLNIIYSSTQLLQLYCNNNEPEILIKKERYLDSIKHNCNRLTRLINNILDITKLDAGFVTLQNSTFNIVTDIETIVTSIVPYAESKGIDIIFDTDEEDIVMSYDKDKIERIILNLISNALKFTNSGGFIFVNLTNKKDCIEISVKDTGIGIAEDKLEIIFERFMQVDKTIRRNHEGTGIGLSIVKAFVELHNGKIELKSEINKGSEFIITLPHKIIPQDLQLINPKIDNGIKEKIELELSDI